METVLDRLAARVGIESEFTDALGKTQQTTPEKKRALLKALELPADDEGQAEATLRAMEERESGRVLPACVVLYAGQEMEVPVRVESGPVRWTVVLEEGGERCGEAEVGAKVLRLPEDLPWGYHRFRLEGVDGAEASLIVTPGRCWLPGEDGAGLPQGLKPRGGAGSSGTAEAVPFQKAGGPGAPQGLKPRSREEEDGTAKAVPLRRAEGDDIRSAALRTGSEAVPLQKGSGDGANAGAVDGGAERSERYWGIAAQVYLLRSERNWGIGDFSDLKRLVEIAREQGADAVGVNPLHGMFLDQPEQASPYSPMSRYLLNVLSIDVEAIPEFSASEAAQKLFGGAEFQDRLARVRAAESVAYEDVAALKLPVLQAVFAEFERAGSEKLKEQFRAFLHGCDELLRVGCTFEAIRQYMTDQSAEYRDCGKWPEAFKHANSAGVREFQRTHAELVRYHLWLQWVADGQLEAVKAACKGMAVGIYRDLAVGAAPSGAEVWGNPEVMVSTAEVGAPPDEWNAAGQNWVLPPFHPQKMKEDGYRSFIALVRTNMRHAGGLRIDHAMSLQRLYWIPRGGKGQDGGYVHYPTDDLIGVLALESHRNKCLVVGEDLGTVAPGFRERMAEANILSYRVLLLEKDKKGYVEGSKYPHMALSTASSHDLPTLRGWWEGVDLELKERIGLTKADAAPKAREEREKDRKALVEMFRRDGLMEGKGTPTTEQFIDAAHRFLARTPAVLMMAQIDDIVEEPKQVNLPATMPDQYPSWSHRVAVTLEELAGDRRLAKLARIVGEERGAGVQVGRRPS